MMTKSEVGKMAAAARSSKKEMDSDGFIQFPSGSGKKIDDNSGMTFQWLHNHGWGRKNLGLEPNFPVKVVDGKRYYNIEKLKEFVEASFKNPKMKSLQNRRGAYKTKSVLKSLKHYGSSSDILQSLGKESVIAHLHKAIEIIESL